LLPERQARIADAIKAMRRHGLGYDALLADTFA